MSPIVTVMSSIAFPLNGRNAFENDSCTTGRWRVGLHDHTNASMKREKGPMEWTKGSVNPTDSFTNPIVRVESWMVV